MTAHPRYQYKAAEPFQTDSSGHSLPRRLAHCQRQSFVGPVESVLGRFRFGSPSYLHPLGPCGMPSGYWPSSLYRYYQLTGPS